jgi:hypothetical protein
MEDITSVEGTGVAVAVRDTSSRFVKLGSFAAVKTSVSLPVPTTSNENCVYG